MRTDILDDLPDFLDPVILDHLLPLPDLRGAPGTHQAGLHIRRWIDMESRQVSTVRQRQAGGRIESDGRVFCAIGIDQNIFVSHGIAPASGESSTAVAADIPIVVKAGASVLDPGQFSGSGASPEY